MQTKIRGGLFLPNTRKLFVQPVLAHDNQKLIEEFLDWKRSYTKWAFSRYRIWVTRFQEFVNLPPERMTANDYVRFTDSIRAGSASKNVQYALNIVHNYLKFFREQGRLNFPMFFIRVPKARSESHYCLSDEEYEMLLRVFDNTSDLVTVRNEAIIRMLHDTGVRIGELLAIDRRSVRKDRSALIPTEKTVDDRFVYWSEETQSCLERYFRMSVPKSDASEGDIVPAFQNSLTPGVRLSARSVQRILKRVCEEAGVSQKICPHSFRHAFIHRMARKGVPDSVTAVLVGHSTPVTISQYTKLKPEEQRYFVESKQIGYQKASFR